MLTRSRSAWFAEPFCPGLYAMTARNCSHRVHSDRLRGGSLHTRPRSALITLAALGALVFGSTESVAHAQTAPAAAPAPAVVAPANTAPAASAPPAPTAAAATEAAEHYDRGLKLHAEGDFALAAIEFERAYELVPNYRALYNIGQVRLQLAHYARAKRALTQYLAEGGDEIPEDRKKAVQADLEMLAGRTGTVALKINVPDAEVSIDDVIVGKSPFAEPLLLDAGEHRISVRKPGYQTKTSQFTLVGGDTMESPIALEKTTVESQRIIVEREKKEDSNHDAWMWGMWTTSGVLAIASGITAGLGVKAAHDLEDQRNEIGASRSELDSASKRAETLLVTGDILGGLAIAAAGTAVYLTLSGDDEEEKAPQNQTPGKSESGPKVGVLVSPFGVNVLGSY